MQRQIKKSLYLQKTNRQEMRKHLFLLVLFGCFAATSLSAKPAKQQSYINYINKYAPIAVVKMQEHGIPASITLAQGILESGAGLSELARKSNNHFGIKCHSDWTGEKVYHDDDKKQECFRKYKSVELSYEDHSQFLKKERYKKLYSLEPTDYKGWAKGLKECGYATASDYAKKLVEIIETYELYNYDNGIIPSNNEGQKINGSDVIAPAGKKEHTMGCIVAYRTHQVIRMGKTRAVKAEEGDTYESIAKEFDVRKWQIRRYNKLQKGSDQKPQVGDTVIIGR